MFGLIKTFLNYVAYQIYHTMIWTLVLALTFHWHIVDHVTFNLNIHMLVGIVLILKIAAGLNAILYPKNYDQTQTGFLEAITPYAILLISFIFKVVLRFWT